jgi:hypothetical protein
MTTEKVGGSAHNVYNHFHKVKFSKNASGLYYLELFQHFLHRKIITDTPYELISTVLTHTVENISPELETEKKKRIYLPFSYYLFRSKFPDSPGFWKK